MNELKENKILVVQVGSKLYGTNTPQSDDDFSGIFIAPKPYYLGLSKVEEIDCSIKSKTSNGKNDTDAVDFKLYEIRKFVKLAMENNPNILEHLFVPKEHIVFSNWYGKKLLAHAHLFPWRGLKQKFLGYAFSQKHKMTIKTDNYKGLKFFNEWLEENTYNPKSNFASLSGKYATNQLLAELRGVVIPHVKFYEHHALVGDINISLSDKLSKVHAKIRDRLSKVGNREELYTKYGYDTKFGMHLVRLMLEGRELLLTGRIEFPLKERDMLLDIRNGKWEREKIISFSEELEGDIEKIEKESKLPSSPNYEAIESLLMNTVLWHWTLGKDFEEPALRNKKPKNEVAINGN